MVLITIVTGAYKPTYNWGASHCIYFHHPYNWGASHCIYFHHPIPPKPVTFWPKCLRLSFSSDASHFGFGHREPCHITQKHKGLGPGNFLGKRIGPPIVGNRVFFRKWDRIKLWDEMWISAAKKWNLVCVFFFVCNIFVQKLTTMRGL